MLSILILIVIVAGDFCVVIDECQMEPGSRELFWISISAGVRLYELSLVWVPIGKTCVKVRQIKVTQKIVYHELWGWD